jgi:hypothetical protein
MAKRQCKKNPRRLVVIVRHIVTPDGKSRLALAARILLTLEGSTAAAEEVVSNTNEQPMTKSFADGGEKHDITSDPDGGT